MWVRRRFVGALLVAAAAIGAAPTTGAASALDDCAQGVVGDWSSDGRVDRVYPLPCYRTALRDLPEDVRAYTDAEQEIRHALAHAQARPAARRAAAGEAPLGASSASSPYRWIVVATPALVLLAACGAGWLGTRRR